MDEVAVELDPGAFPGKPGEEVDAPSWTGELQRLALGNGHRGGYHHRVGTPGRAGALERCPQLIEAGVVGRRCTPGEGPLAPVDVRLADHHGASTGEARQRDVKQADGARAVDHHDVSLADVAGP